MGSQDQVGRATRDDLVGLVLGMGQNGVADNGAKAVDLGSELDLDGLAGLDLGRSLGLVGRQGGVGGNIGSGRDGCGMRESCVVPC